LDAFDPGQAPRPALWESIAAALRRAIILGELPPGLHLEEPALADKFRVSRIPVREALTHLSHEGLVRIEPRRGAFVIGMTAEDIHDFYELRRLLETYAIRHASQHVDLAGLSRLQIQVEAMTVAVVTNHFDQVAEPDLLFHREIVVLAGNQRLLAAWEPIGGIALTMLSITDTTYRDMPRSLASHQRMVHLLESRDADEAETELRRHLANGEEVMRQALRHAVVVPLG